MHRIRRNRRGCIYHYMHACSSYIWYMDAIYASVAHPHYLEWHDIQSGIMYRVGFYVDTPSYIKRFPTATSSASVCIILQEAAAQAAAQAAAREGSQGKRFGARIPCPGCCQEGGEEHDTRTDIVGCTCRQATLGGECCCGGGGAIVGPDRQQAYVIQQGHHHSYIQASVIICVSVSACYIALRCYSVPRT